MCLLRAEGTRELITRSVEKEAALHTAVTVEVNAQMGLSRLAPIAPRQTIFEDRLKFCGEGDEDEETN